MAVLAQIRLRPHGAGRSRPGNRTPGYRPLGLSLKQSWSWENGNHEEPRNRCIAVRRAIFSPTRRRLA